MSEIFSKQTNKLRTPSHSYAPARNIYSVSYPYCQNLSLITNQSFSVSDLDHAQMASIQVIRHILGQTDSSLEMRPLLILSNQGQMVHTYICQ